MEKKRGYLKFELNRLDNVLGKIDTDKKLFLVSAIKLKHKNFNHYLNFQLVVAFHLPQYCR